MRLLSIDIAVAKKTAYALWKDGKLEYYDSIERIEDLDKIIPIADMVICEEPYHQMNIRTYGDLCKEVGKISALCTIYERPFETIRPVDWKRWLKVGSRTPEIIKNEIKRGIINELGYVVSDMSSDEQDAVLLGYYYNTKVGII